MLWCKRLLKGDQLTVSENWLTARALFDEHHGLTCFAIPQNALAVMTEDFILTGNKVSAVLVMDRFYKTPLHSYSDDFPCICWEAIETTPVWIMQVGTSFLVMQHELWERFSLIEEGSECVQNMKSTKHEIFTL